MDTNEKKKKNYKKISLIYDFQKEVKKQKMNLWLSVEICEKKNHDCRAPPPFK